MVRIDHRSQSGFSLVEMLLVVALLGTVLTVVFGAVQVLTASAATNMEESAAAHDLSYSMQLLSKALMSGRLMYANDYRAMVLTQRPDGSYEMNSISTSAGPDPTRNSLVWERWGSDAGGTSVVGTAHTVWSMSDRNMNSSVDPQVPLFAYYKDATDEGLMLAAERSLAADDSLSAFVGSLPGGYPVSAVGRIRLHVLAAFNDGVRDDARDIVLRVRS